MSYMYAISITIFCLTISFTITHFFVDHAYQIGVMYLLYLIVSRQFPHFIEKRRLVNGDLVFIKYRGKYRKAFVTCVSVFSNVIQIQFFDNNLNIDLTRHNWYSISRIILPDYMSKAAKILYSDLKD